jgi:hypothetical protein
LKSSDKTVVWALSAPTQQTAVKRERNDFIKSFLGLGLIRD